MAEIERRDVRDVTVIDIKGALTIGDGNELILTTFRRLRESSRSLVILNLAGVPYIEDSPLGALIGCCAEVATSGGRIRFVNARPRVAEFISITKAEGCVFEYCDSEEAAVSALMEHQEGKPDEPSQ